MSTRTPTPRRTPLARLTALLALGLSAVALPVACGDDNNNNPPPDGGTVLNGRPVYAVTFDNRLLFFGSGAPGTLVRTTPISGLPAGERIVAVDFRPVDHLLYGVGTDSRLYTLNLTTAAATSVSQAPFSVALDGEHFGLDFNPMVDRLRVGSVETEQNLRINPADGTLVAQDTPFAYAVGDVNEGVNPALGGLAYTNSVPGATSTVLYGIDSNTNSLVTLASPNSGQLMTVGAVGTNTVPCVGFDIDPSDGGAYAALADNGVTSFYTVNLTTGAATLVGTIPINSEVQGISVAP
jgi:Domain of unknown function (DUF4394)